jgi:Ni,Fe-hydrogenase III large subunit
MNAQGIGPGLPVRNAQAFALKDVPRMGAAAFRDWLVGGCAAGGRIAAWFAHEGAGPREMLAVLAMDDESLLEVAATAAGDSFESISRECPQAQAFERELREQWGIEPRGHPWLKPVRFAPGRGPGAGLADFYRVEGSEVHEVAVGPVHAGVIEPGHFRFQCHGEQVLHLEIALGYQHRGVERALNALPAGSARWMAIAETLAGDTTLGHATAACHLLEALAGREATGRGMAIRGIALELERIANHVGDLGALANDVGYLPTASFCGRLRGDALNLTADLCGNRFGRGLARPGGAGHDLDAKLAETMLGKLEALERDVNGACELLWASPSVMARLEGTGCVSREDCDRLGLVGVAARACGAGRDARHDFPSGIHRFGHIPVCTWDTGDVFARAFVRAAEVRRSFTFLREQLSALPAGAARVASGAPSAGMAAVSLVEGWRGEVCHVGFTRPGGKSLGYKVVDASFHNWPGLALALRGQAISDFPLCNKSFNLSYCGHDL